MLKQSNEKFLEKLNPEGNTWIMKRFWMIVIFIILNNLVFGQTKNDIIIKMSGDTIHCVITLSNSNNIFYTIKSGKRSEENLIISLTQVASYRQAGVLTTIQTPFQRAFSSFVVDTTTSKYSFTEVVRVENNTKDELFSKAKEWVTHNFKSAKDVLQMDDRIAGEIICKGWTDIFIDGETILGINTSTFVKMNFTVEIKTKEGRYKYNISNISYQAHPSGENLYPMEYSAEEFYKRNVSRNFAKYIPIYKEKSLEAVNNTAGSLKRALGAKKNEDDGW